jgi:hypothetical protein
MTLIRACVTVVLVLSAGMAHAQTIDKCAAGLAPNLILQDVQKSVRYAFLELINDTNYDRAKTAIKASGDIDLLGLIKIGSAEANYQQFQDRYREFKKTTKTTYDTDSAVSLVTSSVPDSARTDYFACVRGSTGLRVYMKEQRPDSATVEVHFLGEPGSSVAYKATILNAARVPPLSRLTWGYWWGKTLNSGATDTFIVSRDGVKDIRVAVNAKNYSGDAVSIVPLPPVPAPVAPPSTISIIVASYAANCGHSNNATLGMQAACNGRTSCNYNVNWQGADLCVGTHKNFQYDYTCSPSTKPVRVTEGGPTPSPPREMATQTVHVECKQ